jgi:hypothetical protein
MEDIRNASGSESGSGGSSELLLQVSKQRTKIASLEKQTKDLEDQLYQEKSLKEEKEDQCRMLRLDIAKQKKSIQKTEAALERETARNSTSGASGEAQTFDRPQEEAQRGSSSSTSPKARAWQEKARKERELLGRAKKYVDSQKKEIRRRQKRIEHDRKDWREDMQKSSRSNSSDSRSRSRKQMLKEIKKSLEHDSEELNKAIAHLRSMDQWLREREKKVTHLESVAFNGGMGSMDDSLDASRTPSGGGISGDESSQDAERLSSELDDDYSFMNQSMQEDEGGYSRNPRMWQQYMSGGPQFGGHRQRRRSRQQAPSHGYWADPSAGFDPANQMYAAAAAAAAAAIQQQQQQRQPYVNGWMNNLGPQQYADENVDMNMERQWMARGRPAAERVGGATNGTFFIFYFLIFSFRDVLNII